MHHTFIVLTVKMVKSVYIYASYRKIKTGVGLSLFWTTQCGAVIIMVIMAQPLRELTRVIR